MGAPTATRGFGGTVQSGEDVKPARPGNLGIAAGAGSLLGTLGVLGVLGVLGGATAALGGGRARSGADVKPQGFLGSFIGSVWTSRALGPLGPLGPVACGLGGR